VFGLKRFFQTGELDKLNFPQYWPSENQLWQPFVKKKTSIRFGFVKMATKGYARHLQVYQLPEVEQKKLALMHYTHLGAKGLVRRLG
jgi:hypothetical protein